MNCNKYRISIALLSLLSLGQYSAMSQEMISVGQEVAPPVEIRFNQNELTVRYKLSENAAGVFNENLDQERLILDMSILFFQGFVRIDVQGATGDSFQGTWASSGLINGNPQLDFFIRRLSMTLNPLSGLEISAGSMAPDFGAGSENSSMSENGYIMGYRVKAKLDKTDLVVTGGYLGDFANPNVFTKISRMTEFNYLQAMWTQSIGTMIQTSLEYDRLGVDNLGRAAIKLDTSSFTKFLDLIQVEGMLGLDPNMSTPDRAVLFTAKIAKNFKDVFGEILPGRTLQTALSYIYYNGKLDFPVAERIFKDHQIRFTASVPDLFVFNDRTSLGTYLDLIKSFTDLSTFRAEVGMSLKF